MLVHVSIFAASSTLQTTKHKLVFTLALLLGNFLDLLILMNVCNSAQLISSQTSFMEPGQEHAEPLALMAISLTTRHQLVCSTAPKSNLTTSKMCHREHASCFALLKVMPTM
jgi:hypothetical protein